MCGLLCASVSIHAVQMTLDRRAIEEAILLGQSRQDADRNRFHRLYRLTISRPPVDWIDVITPYHRVALAAEARARLADRIFGQREALAALNAVPPGIELLVELTFHPLNTFVGVPAYDVSLTAPQASRIRPRHIDRVPRFGPRTDSMALSLPVPNAPLAFGGGQPVMGGTILAQFSAGDINPNGLYDVVLAEAGKELARVALDLGKLR